MYSLREIYIEQYIVVCSQNGKLNGMVTISVQICTRVLNRSFSPPSVGAIFPLWASQKCSFSWKRFISESLSMEKEHPPAAGKMTGLAVVEIFVLDSLPFRRIYDFASNIVSIAGVRLLSFGNRL